MDNNEYIMIPFMKGNSGEVTVTITNATFRITKSQEKRYVDKEFGKWLVQQIYNNIDNQAKTSGFLGIGNDVFFCPKCSTNLDTKKRKSLEIEIQLTYRSFQPMIIKFTLPSVVCSKCGKENVIDTSGQPGSSVYGAINRAFESEEIKPR
jgi:hypothetical protein